MMTVDVRPGVAYAGPRYAVDGKGWQATSGVVLISFFVFFFSFFFVQISLHELLFFSTENEKMVRRRTARRKLVWVMARAFLVHFPC